MAQVTETVARGILAGHGYTDNEVRQLAHHWLASHGLAPAGTTVYPMACDEDEPDLGAWQDGATKPTIDGIYLRDFDEGQGTSEFYEGKWLRDGFFPSDIQDARWRGRNAPHPTPTAQSADSVLEDAADPLQGAANWLAEAHGQFSPIMLAGCLMIGYNRAKRLHDAALAARKQGASQ